MTVFARKGEIIFLHNGGVRDIVFDIVFAFSGQNFHRSKNS